MNRQLIENWIGALRSGEYQQARFQLKNWSTNAYCCLGVACDIHPNMEWGSHTDRFNAFPPTDIMNDYGIALGSNKHLIDKHRLIIGCLEVRHIGELLAYLNDELNWSFSRIADWIEQNLLPLATDEENIQDSM